MLSTIFSLFVSTNTFEISQRILNAFIIKISTNRYFVLCTIISPACIWFQNLAKQTKVHCKKNFFFSIIALLYVGAKLCSVRRVLASFFVSQSFLLLYVYFWVINEVETCFTLVVFLCSSHCGVFSRQVKKSTSNFRVKISVV